MYFYIEPEVSGGFGKNNQADTTVHPPNVSKLHYLFDGWLEDDILETFPCFIVTKRLKNALMQQCFTGFSIDDVEISKSEQFDNIYPNKTLPNFYWLKVTGVAGKDDFGIANDHRLVISQRILNLLKTVNIVHADLEPLKIIN
ncbi:MAG: hypothetical protein HRT35_09655 [Algicola sp.]|nr:hypothetical protein [Algicola sp.]